MWALYYRRVPRALKIIVKLIGVLLIIVSSYYLYLLGSSDVWMMSLFPYLVAFVLLLVVITGIALLVY